MISPAPLDTAVGVYGTEALRMTTSGEEPALGRGGGRRIAARTTIHATGNEFRIVGRLELVADEFGLRAECRRETAVADRMETAEVVHHFAGVEADDPGVVADERAREETARPLRKVVGLEPHPELDADVSASGEGFERNTAALAFAPQTVVQRCRVRTWRSPSDRNSRAEDPPNDSRGCPQMDTRRRRSCNRITMMSHCGVVSEYSRVVSLPSCGRVLPRLGRFHSKMERSRRAHARRVHFLRRHQRPLCHPSRHRPRRAAAHMPHVSAHRSSRRARHLHLAVPFLSNRGSTTVRVNR